MSVKERFAWEGVPNLAAKPGRDEEHDEHERTKRGDLLMSIEQVSAELSIQVAALQRFVAQLKTPPPSPPSPSKER